MSGLELASRSFTAEYGISPGQYPQFTFDLDKPSKGRYNELFTYFKEPLASMEEYWWT